MKKSEDSEFGARGHATNTNPTDHTIRACT